MVTNMAYVRCIFIRDLLSLTVEEAAQYIGGVGIREWLNWEGNILNVPDYVLKQIDEVAYRHKKMIKLLVTQKDHSEFVLPEYESFEDYLADHPGESYIDWKIAQNISAYTNVIEN